MSIRLRLWKDRELCTFATTPQAVSWTNCNPIHFLAWKTQKLVMCHMPSLGIGFNQGMYIYEYTHL